MKTHINGILPGVRKTNWVIFKTVKNAKKKKSMIEMNEFKITTYKMAFNFFLEIKKKQAISAKENYDLRNWTHEKSRALFIISKHIISLMYKIACCDAAFLFLLLMTSMIFLLEPKVITCIGTQHS